MNFIRNFSSCDKYSKALRMKYLIGKSSKIYQLFQITLFYVIF